MQTSLPSQNLMRLVPVRHCILVLLLFVLSVTNGYGQTASVTWPLTADPAALTTGNVSAPGLGAGGVGFITYGPNGVTADTWTTGAVPEDWKYYLFTVSPSAGNNLLITDISLETSTDGTTGDALIQYSYDPSFSSPVTLGSTFAISTMGPAVTTFSGLSLPVNNSQVLYFRVHAWNISTFSNVFTVRNFTINGSTVSCLPDITDFSTLVPSAVCEGSSVNITVNSSSLLSDNYTVTYDLSGANTASGLTASLSFTAGAPGSGIFTIPASALVNTGNTSVTITAITSSTNCTSNLSSGNSATATVTALPVATFSYTASPYCASATDPSPTFSGGGAAGVFSSAAGLVFVNTATGEVDLSASAPGTYTVTNTIAAAGGCGVVTATSDITITADNTISLSSAAGTDAQTLCINTTLADITYNTTGATGATFSGLPAGVTGNWAANVVTISGTPTAGGIFNYTVTLAGGCGNIAANGSITVTPDNTISLSSAAGTNAQALCINTALTNITYNTTGATGASFSGLPAGVTGNWAANVVTISGTPTANGTFNYTVTLTGGCGSITANGSVTVTPNNTITLTSAAGTNAQTLCINTTIANITYSTTGATGASFSGLPAGVTGNWAANVVTISGTPTASGTFNYTVTLTGGCGNITANGSITVTPNNTITLSSAAGTNAQTLCINTAITGITYSTTGATGATFSGLPAGVTGNWAANVVTISGTPTASGTFNYTVTSTGGCTTPAVTATGSIAVTPNNTITRTSAAGTDAQTRCINVAITNITYSTTGATGATFSGLPAGVTGNWAGNVATISGTPTANGTFNYTVTTTGGCTTPIVTASGTITVTANNTITLSSAAGTNAQTRCISTAITNITYSTTGATGATFSGLPAGVSGNWAGNVVTISGTPSASGTFNYTITTTGGCTTPAVTATGTIIVTPNNTITLTSAAGTNAQTRCISTVITNITYSTTGATGATFSGLPAGVSGNWASNVVTISGTPTASGTFNYTVTLTGGCGSITATGSITVYDYPAATGVTICQNGSGSLTSSAACAASIPGTAGPNFAGAGATSGGAGTAWTNPGNVVSNNNSYALADNLDAGDVSEGLRATNFGFAVPAAATITGVQVSIGRFASNTNTFTDNSVLLMVGGVTVGADRAAGGFWPTSETVANYGSSSDLWGTTLTPAQVNANNFGVSLAVESSNGTNRDANVDYIQITISYTIPGSLNWYTASSGGSSIGNGTPFNPVGVAGSGLSNTATPGTTTFYAECAAAAGCRTAVNFVINPLPTITGTTTVCIGLTTTLTGNGTPAASNPWVSSNTSVATVNSSGVVTGVAVGTSTITYTNNNGCSNTATVTVSAPAISGTFNVCIGSTRTLTGNGTPAASNPWVSSNTSVATVNSSGVVTGVAAGTTNITYTNNNGCFTTISFTVNALPVVSITGSNSICAGGPNSTTTLSPTSGGTWASSNNSIATVTNAGAVTGVAAGSVTFTFTQTSTGCSSTTAAVTVNARPTATFTTTPGANVCVNTNVTYTTQAGQSGYTWTIPGTAGVNYTIISGGTSADNTVTLQWLTSGSKTVTVNYSNANGCTSASAASNTNTANARPAPTFTTQPGAAVCASTNVTYTTQTGQSSYVWTVPGTAGIDYNIISGGIGSGSNTATLQWLTSGSKNVTVNYTNGSGCTGLSAASNTTTVNARPIANAITGPNTVCVGSTINLTSNATGTPSLSYTWNSSNGNATVTNTGVVTGVSAGTSNITYTVTDGNTCSATSPNFSVTINARPTPTITITPSSTICASVNITYTTQPAMTNYTWTIPGVAGVDYTIITGGTSADNAVTLQWLTTGVKNVTINYTNGNSCTGAAAGTSSTTVNARPTPTFTTQPGAAVCATAGVNTYDITYTTQAGQSNYVWNLPGVAGTDYTIIAGGIGAGSNTVTLRWLTTGSKTVTVNYNNSNGCTALTAASNTTTVNPLPVVNTSASSVCVNSTITAAPNSAGTWISSNNGIATIDNAGLITGVSAGSVTFTYTLAATGCASTTSSVTVNPLPVIAPISGGAAAICVNDITIFSDATAGGTWSIINGAGTASIDASGLVTGLTPGNVTVVYTYSNGICTNSVSTPLTINPIPTVGPIGGGASAVCVNANTPAFTNATAGGTWSIIDGTGSASVNGSGVVTGLSAGSVTVVYTVDNGTCSNESAVSLTINPLPPVASIGGGAASVCVNSSTPAFTNATGGGVWSIINGTGTASITAGGVVTGLSGGTVTVAYTVNNGTCSNTATQLLTVNPLPVIAAIGGGAATVCIASSTPAFTNATPSGVWSITNGSGTASITAGGVVTGLTAGTVTVVYTVTTGSGCTGFVTAPLTVNALPVANAITGANTVCAGSSISLNSNASGTPALTYTWNSNNSNATVTNAGVITGVTAGSSNITYTVTDGNNCSAISPSFTVNVDARPTATITSGNTTICDGSPVNITGTVTATGAWTLTLSNGATTSGTGNGIFSISVSPAVTTTYTVTSLVDVNCSSIAADLAGSTTVTVNDNVVIATQPAVTQTVCSGSSVSITVAATGTGLTYQWRKGLTPLSNGGNIAGATSATLVLNPVGVGDAATDYNVVISGAAPCASVTSANSELIVNQAVAITTQPVSHTECSGNSVSFTVGATGDGLTYQWRRNGSPLTDGGDISGSTSATLNISNLTAANAGNYTVVVSGLTPCAPVTSGIAVLTVNTAVVITTQPADTVAVCATFPATFTVAATGSGLTYQWYKGTFPGTLVTNNANISGATTASLHFNQANLADIEDYYVIVSGLAPCSPVQSAYAHLSVDQTITINQQPVAQTVCTGSDAQFVVVASAGPDPLNYQWRKNGVDIPGANSDTLNIIGATAADAGVYRVVITGIAGCVTSLSNIVSLTVNPASVGGTVNSDATVCGGINSGTLTLTGHTGNVARWEFSTDGGSLWTPIANTTTSQSYTNLTAVTMYRAVVKSGVCAEDNSSAATISFYPVPDVIPSPSSQTICSGGIITTIVLSGSVPSTSYTWTRNNTGTATGIAASGSGNINGVLTNTTLSPVTATFTITPTANGCTGPSTTATVTVDPSPDAFATPSSQTICSGGAITTIALSSTVPSTTYTWTRDNTGTVTGIAASGTGDISGVLTNTSTSPVTVTFTIMPSAAGCNGASITATVVVDPIPNAIATPSSQTICSGGTITTIALSSAVSGTAYTWTRNNTGTVTGIAASGNGNVSGTLTNTTLSPVTVTFTITPSFNGCTGTPITATVLVNPSPDALATPSSQSVCTGTAITTIALSSSVPSTTYTWTRDNTGSVTGIAASGSGNISGSLTNTTSSPVTVTFTVTPSSGGCAGPAITAAVTVNPGPNSTATPSSQIVCSGAAITTIVLTSTTPSAVFNWTRNNTGTLTGIGASGSGDISGTLVNTTNASVTATFTITANIGGCLGNPITATVQVRPTPTVSVTNNNQTLCGGVAITSMVISNPSAVAGTSFSWTRDNTVNLTGIGASGTGSPISGTFVNNTAVQQATTFTVTATASGCSSSTTATVTVNPRPTMTSTNTVKICNNSNVNLALTSNIPSSFVWVAANNNNVSGESTTNQSSGTINNTLVNTSPSPGSGAISLTPRQNVTYTVTPTAGGTGCAGIAQTVTVTVNPPYNISFYEYPTDDNGFTICDGDLVGGGGQNDMDLIEGEYSGATLVWQYSIGNTSGPWNPVPGPHINGAIHDTLPDPPSIFSPMGNYYFRLSVDGCLSDTITMTKTSTLTIEAGADKTVCESGTPSAIALTGATVGGTASTTVGGTWSIYSLSPANGGVNGTLSSTAFQTAANIPNVTYTPPANYSGVITLMLTSNDPDGNGPCGPLVDTVHINVSQAPIVSNPATAAICSGSNTNITLTSVIPSTYTWTVGTITGSITGASAGSGNNISQVLNNPSSSTAGTVQYIITPTPVSPAACAAVTSSITVTVRPLPSPSLTRSPATVCSGSSSTLTATNSGGTLNGTISGNNYTQQAISTSSTSTITSIISLPAGTITAASAITLTMNLTHSWAGDLRVTLISPGCGSTVLFNRPGGNGNNNDLSGNYTFVSSGGATFPANTNPITAQTYNANFSGISFPCNSSAGNWILQIEDLASQDGGNFNNWTLSINTNGVYTSVFNGNATIGSVSYSGTGNTTATASVTPPVGVNNYTVTTTDAFGCSNTSSSVSVTVNAPPSLSGVSQAASVCAGSSAQINLTGMQASSTSTITYKINGGPTQVVTGVVADASGNASFNSIALTAANNGQTLQITSLTTTSPLPSCSQLLTQNMTLSVNAMPTLTGASQSTTVCPGSSAQINMSGLVPNNIISVTYTINGGPTQTVTNIAVGAGGTANFTTIGLTTANNGQTLQITGVTITSALPNCSQTFTRNVTLSVNPNPVLNSTLAPSTICSGATFSYVPSSPVPGATFAWTRASVPGISQPANSGSGNISEVLTNTTAAPVNVTFMVTTTANGCNNSPGENVVLTVNPAPALSTVSQAATVCAGNSATINLTGLIPSSTSTIFYSINGISQPSVAGVASNGSGNASFTSANLTAANNGQVLRVTGVSTTSNTPTCARTFSIITLLSVNAIPTLSGASQAAPVCLSGPATINITGLVANSVNNTINYTINGVVQTPITGVNANGSGAASFNTNALTAANNGQILQVTGITNGGCSQSFTQNVTLAVGTINTWLGVNTNWFDPSNWCAGIPTSTTDVLIPGSLTFYPVVNAGIPMVRNITIQATASVNLSNTKMQIAGSITNTGAFNAAAGTIELNGISGAQTISGSSFVNRMLDGLIISNTSGVNVSGTANDTLNIADSLAFGNVNNTMLNTGNNITLLSRAAKTARVSDITNGGANTGNSFTGKVMLERFIPERRAWRMMTVPLQQAGSQTFNVAWQEGVVNPDYVYANHIDPHPGYGMLITGPTAGVGFDPSPMNNYSVQQFNPLTLTWGGVPNTLTAKVTDSAGYMVFVRGDRSTQIYLNTAAPTSNTILRTSGFLKTNLQTLNVPAGSGGYSLVGNPYASSIDLRKVSTGGAVSGVNYVVWDPALTGSSGVGAYQYLTRSGGPGTDYLVFPGNSAAGGGSYGAAFSVNNNIQSSQAFLVQNAGAGTVNINEDAKIIPNTSTVFRPGSPASAPVQFGYISTLLMYENGSQDALQLVDGALMMYRNDYSNAIDLEDAKKMNNFSSENFGISSNGEWMQIEKRNGILANDTIFFKAKSYRVRDYQFKIEAANITQTGLTAFLEDNYLHVSTPVSLQGTTVYRFKVTVDSGAWRQDRFRIVFKQGIVVPVTFSSVKAYRNNDYIHVDWKTEHELSIAGYEVERSTDGTRFTKTYTEVNVVNNDRGAAYSWVDKDPVKGFNYYRIKSKDVNGAVKYTSVVKVLFEKAVPSITLYPNPLVNGIFNLYFVNEVSGEYKLRLMNSAGQLIEAAKINHVSTTATEIFRPKQQLLQGNYILEVTRPDGTKQILNAMY